MTQSGFLGPKAIEQERAKQPLRPDEVLFKAANAPTRFEETDYYYAHRNLPKDQKLPDGELLSALHVYISKLYSRTQEPGGQKAWKCMDETALIALGILLEESTKGILGETGDFALVEGARSEEEDPIEDEESVARGAFSGKESRARSGGQTHIEVFSSASSTSEWDSSTNGHEGSSDE